MRTEIYQERGGEWATHVYLSRRNILALLAKLDGYPTHSASTLLGPIIYPATSITAEEDDVHYAHESRDSSVPGRMHPDTEQRLAHREAADA